MIRTEDLVIGYQTDLGQPINIALGSGQFHVILGPNGSGKSTLFKTLIGLLTPRSGKVSVEGKPLSKLTASERARTFAFVPQTQQQIFPYTVREMVLMGRTGHIKPFSAPGQADHEATDQAIAALQLGHLANQEFTKLSGGQRQMTILARALAQAARVLVLDEPTASLDFGNEIRVLEKVRALADQGWTIILSTHNPTHALQLADTVTTFKEGSIVAHGAPIDLLDSAHLSTLYGADISVVQVDETHACVARQLSRHL